MEMRGLDGLSEQELRATRLGFWDDGFTQVLIRRFPDGVRTLVDVGCGLATAAHALLPRLAAVSYVGIDADEQRLRKAEELLVGASYAARVELRAGLAERLPFPDAQADLVLTCMTMQHLVDAAAAAREMRRVLAPRGRVVAVEPDNLSNSFYFDVNLDEVNVAFRSLFGRLRCERSPANLAIGPCLARLFEREGFSIVEFFPYAVGRAKKLPAKEAF
ncbi:MAG: class I SAM-dependent methyltransferase, partial [Pseudomonadota bacterium]